MQCNVCTDTGFLVISHIQEDSNVQCIFCSMGIPAEGAPVVGIKLLPQCKHWDSILTTSRFPGLCGSYFPLGKEREEIADPRSSLFLITEMVRHTILRPPHLTLYIYTHIHIASGNWHTATVNRLIH